MMAEKENIRIHKYGKPDVDLTDPDVDDLVIDRSSLSLILGYFTNLDHDHHHCSIAHLSQRPLTRHCNRLW